MSHAERERMLAIFYDTSRPELQRIGAAAFIIESYRRAESDHVVITLTADKAKEFMEKWPRNDMPGRIEVIAGRDPDAKCPDCGVEPKQLHGPRCPRHWWEP
jgi:hypothetical protein